MQQFKQILRGLLSAQTLAGSLGYGRLIDGKPFLRDLKTEVDNTTVGRGVTSVTRH
jgi:hypothetical protein